MASDCFYDLVRKHWELKTSAGGMRRGWGGAGLQLTNIPSSVPGEGLYWRLSVEEIP